MNTEVLLAEIAVAIRTHRGTPDPSCACVLGLEALARERWRVWFQPCDTVGTLLYIVTLRSNCAGRSFDVKAALSIAGWRALSGRPSSAFTSARRLVGEFDRQRGLFGRREPREYREIQVASLPLPFADPWDRLWVIGDAVGQAAQPAETLLVWEHGGILFLATGWNGAISAALGTRRERLSTDAGRPGKTAAAPRGAQRNK